jgi:hypothetical protein
MATNQRNKTSGRKSQSANQPSTRRGSQHETHRMEEIREQASEYVARGASQFREMTRDHEGSAVLVAFAAGFGIGLLIGGAMASSHQRPRSWSDRIAAEGIGRRLLERVESMIPEAITDRFSR